MSEIIFLCLTSLNMIICVYPHCCKWHYFILFNRSVIFHYIYVLHLYSFLCQSTFRLLPCLGYCKQFYSDYWGVSFSYGFSGSMSYSGIAGSYGSYVFNFLRNTHTVLQWLYQFTFPLQCRGVLFSPCPHQHLLFVDIFMMAIWPV